MKDIKFIVIIFSLLLLPNLVKADSNISLKNYLDKNNIEDGSTQIYLLSRCLSLIHISEPTRPERIGFGGVWV